MLKTYAMTVDWTTFNQLALGRPEIVKFSLEDADDYSSIDVTFIEEGEEHTMPLSDYLDVDVVRVIPDTGREKIAIIKYDREVTLGLWGHRE